MSISPRRFPAALLLVLLVPFLASAQRHYPNGTPIKRDKRHTVDAVAADTSVPPDPAKVSDQPAGRSSTRIAAKATEKARAADKSLRHDLLERSERAATVVREIIDAPDHGLNQSVIDKASCVAVVPSLKKGGFGFGGQWGRGVISCRNDSKGWSPPSYFTLSGGSFGFQIGFEAVDLVMVISSRSGVNSIIKDKVEVGASASATALVVGRTMGVSTDPLLNARIFSYSRTQGLFAGLELKGAYVRMDEKANRLMYGSEVHAHDIFANERLGSAGPGSSLYSFSRTLKEISPAKVKYVRVRKVAPPEKAG